MGHKNTITETRIVNNYFAQAGCECGWAGGLHNSLLNLRKQLRDANWHLWKMRRATPTTQKDEQ